MTNQTVGRLAYSIRETAPALGISEASAYKLIQRGQLPTVMIGRKRFVDASRLRCSWRGSKPSNRSWYTGTRTIRSARSSPTTSERSQQIE